MYVYDYCYIMRQAADSNAQRHWLLKDSYNGTRGKGAEVLKLYRCAASTVQVQVARMHGAFVPERQLRVEGFAMLLSAMRVLACQCNMLSASGCICLQCCSSGVAESHVADMRAHLTTAGRALPQLPQCWVGDGRIHIPSSCSSALADPTDIPWLSGCTARILNQILLLMGS